MLTFLSKIVLPLGLLASMVTSGRARELPWTTSDGDAVRRAVESLRIERGSTASDIPPWSSLGPGQLSGPVIAVAHHSAMPNRRLLGAAGGGIWRSEDAGATWSAIFDTVGSPLIASLAIAPSDPFRILCATGEAPGSPSNRGASGLFQSTDGGDRWHSLGLDEVSRFGNICIAPHNSEIIGVSALGWRDRPDTQRGIYRSSDGGENWSRVHYVNDRTGFVEIRMDPSNPKTLLAAAWDTESGAASGVHRSTNGGKTWEKAGAGLPSPAGRIGIASLASAKGFWAVVGSVDGEFAGLYSSLDAGISWNRHDDGRALEAAYGEDNWSYGAVRSHPVDASHLFVLGDMLYETTDGGVTWATNGQDHISVSQHDLDISSSDPMNMMVASDGGISRTLSGGLQWIASHDLAIAQVNSATGTPDDSTLFLSATNLHGMLRLDGAPPDDWTATLPGDVTRVALNKRNPMRIYATTVDGTIWSSVNRGDSWQEATAGINPAEPRDLRPPLEIDPSHPRSIYTATNRVYVSHDNGGAWTATSAILPHEPNAAITAISVHPTTRAIVWAGASDGSVHVTSDRGLSWSDVTDGLPEGGQVTTIATTPESPGGAYLAFSGPGFPGPFLYRTEDLGDTWEPFDRNLGPSAPTNAIEIHPINERWVYIGNDVGVFMTSDAGETWQEAGTGLPIVPITDLWLNPVHLQLVAASYGRGTWVVDSSGEAVGIHDPDEPAPSRSALLGTPAPNPFNPNVKLPVFLKQGTSVSLRLYDVAGFRVRTLHNGWLAPGHHTFTWDGLNDSGTISTSGVYLLRLDTKAHSETRRLLLLR